MRFTIEMQCDNAAFEDCGNEVAWILRKVADKIDGFGRDMSDVDEGSLLDSNGNRVGAWTFDASR